MGIQSFKAQKGDPDWAFTPDQYFDKEFKVIDASVVELSRNQADRMVLRQTPTEKEMLAKHIRIDVCENSSLDLTIINEAADNMQQVFIYDIHVRDRGQINMGLFAKGGKLNKHIVQIKLENFANFNGYGYMCNDASGDSELITKIEHLGSASISNQFFVFEAGTNSQTVFQSWVQVEEDTEFTQVGVDASNLITGPNGRCQSVPQVFNDTYTSKISSRSDTEFLDPDKIYYLQTRGMPKDRARSLLIDQHRNRVLDIIPSEDIKEEIIQLLS